MFRKIAASLVFAAAFSAGPAVAEEPNTHRDIAQEVLAGSITIPVEDRGYILVKGCSSCSEMRLDTTPDTTFEIGDTPVRREQMRLELQRRPRQLMLLQLTPDYKRVARLVIRAE